MVRRLAQKPLEALATAVLAVALVAGSAFLWIGIPLLGFWLAGELTTTTEAFLLAALGGVPLAMVSFGWLLYRLNAVYEGLHGGRRPGGSRAAWLVSSSDERGKVRRARAPRALIDVAMTTSAVVALVLFLIWFFFFAEMRLVRV
jgi:hypothetical protein